MGHEVEIRDAMAEPGGMMHYGIPAYRLPRAELLREIGRIEAMGVRIVMNTRVDDVERGDGGRAASTPASSRSAPRTAITSTFRRADGGR